MIEQYFTTMRENVLQKVQRWRPIYHFSPPISWMNDPNGLIYFKGWYHLFYQYNPYSCEWGSMHWGHAVSKDMMHWKDLPIALYPDQYYECHTEGGCFSGSAIEKDEKLYLFYTSVMYENGEKRQTQSIAISEDGIHFQKYEGNPVIQCVPEGMSADFRDPKVLKVGERWYMVVGGSLGGADQLTGDGRIFLYRSDDLFHWDFVNVLLESNGMLGTMFECPDLFPLQGKWILTCSPMNHPTYNKVMYCVGEIDFESGIFIIERIGCMDDGYDYYAPQSFLDSYGNRILIGWMNGWDWMPWHTDFGPTTEEGWRGVLSIPRKAILDEKLNLKLCPVDEFWKLTETLMICEEYKLSAKKSLKMILDSQSFVIHLKILISKVKSEYIEIGILENGNKGAVIKVDLTHMLMSFDKKNVDCYGTGMMSTVIEDMAGQVDIKILVDRSTVEIYANEGEKCISCNVYPGEEQKTISIAVPYKEAVLDWVRVYKVNSVF